MRHGQWTSLLVASGLLLGCGFGGGSKLPGPAAATEAAVPGPASGAATTPPSGLVYPTDPAVYTRGQAIAANVPFYTGGPATSMRLASRLPAGLAFDPVTGAISGTPTALAPAAVYRVTAANSAGSTEASLTLTVNDPAPAAAPVVTLAPFVSASRQGLSASVPDQGPGVSYVWTLTGATLDRGQGTPAVSFTAGAAGTVTATVTVSNSGGSLSASAQAAIVPMPAATLTLPQVVRAGTGASASVSTQEGMTCQWSVVSGSATITSGQGSTRVGLAVGSAEGSFELQVRVQNQAGDYAVASGMVKVQAGS